MMLSTRTSLLLVSFLCAVILPHATAYAWEPLSADWYRLPEDQPATYSPPARQEETRGKLALFHSLDQIFSANSEALEVMETETQASEHRGKFRLSSLSNDLGVSVEGFLAPLNLQGTATVSVSWTKRASPRTAPSPEAAVPEVAITSDSTREETNRQLEPMIQVALATKQVKDEKNLRKNLEETATTFYEMSRALDGDAVLSQWWVGRFRVDVWIDALGTVHPGVQVGAGFRLRFEWHRLKRKRRSLADNERLSPSPMQKKFRTFVEQLAVDAQEVSFKALEPTGFYPVYIKVGVGFTAQQNVGIVQWDGGVAGYLYLFTEPKPPKRQFSPSETDSTSLAIIERNPSSRHLAYARANGITYETTAKSNDGLIKEVIYKLERWRFRRGLRRAVKMSSRIASRAKRVRQKKWRISTLTTTFDLAIGGDFKLVSIQGYGSIEISYNNGNS